MALLQEIADRLVSQGVGVLGTSIFLSSSAVIPVLPNPTAFLVLTATGGTGSNGTHNNTATETPTVSLVVRAEGYLAAYAILKAAYDALGGANGLHNLTLLGTSYLSIKARQTPTDLGRVDGYATLSFTIDTEKQPS